MLFHLKQNYANSSCIHPSNKYVSGTCEHQAWGNTQPALQRSGAQRWLRTCQWSIQSSTGDNSKEAMAASSSPALRKYRATCTCLTAAPHPCCFREQPSFTAETHASLPRDPLWEVRSTNARTETQMDRKAEPSRVLDM